MSLERVKLDNSNVTRRLMIDRSKYQRMHDRLPKMGVTSGHVTSLNFGK